MAKCNHCEKVLIAEEIVNVEKEYSYICHGEAYDALEDVPSQRRDEAEYCETVITTYECSKCGTETTIEK